MTTRLRKVAAILGVVLVTISHCAPVTAECVVLSPAQMKKLSPWVFAGRLTDKQPVAPGAFRVAFDVARVWKGDVPKHVVVYQVMSLDSVVLEEGKDYVVFGQPLRQEVWSRVGTTSAEPAFAVPDCGGAMEFRQGDERLRHLGRSKPPK